MPDIPFDGTLWLVANQSVDGSWSNTDPHSLRHADVQCTRTAIIEATCYATLAVAEDVLSSRPEDAAKVRLLRASVAWLEGVQSPTGRIIGPTSIDMRRDHALALLSLSESYRAVGEPSWRPSLERGADQLLAMQVRYAASAACPCDACACFRECMTILAARSLGYAGVSRGARAVSVAGEAVRPSLRRLLSEQTRDVRATEAPCVAGCTIRLGIAAGVLALELLASDGDAVLIAEGVSFLSHHSPYWNTDGGTIDYRYWLFGTIAVERADGASWLGWRQSAVRVALDYVDPVAPAPFPLIDHWSRTVGPTGPVAAMTLMEQYIYGAGAFRLLSP